MLTNCEVQHSSEVRLIIPKVLRLLGPGRTQPVKLMCVGMPNVGKSSLLNALRRTMINKGAWWRRSRLG